MLGFNKYGSYGWVMFENLEGLAYTKDLEMQGYHRGCIATLAGEMATNQMKAGNVEFSTEIYEKQVDRVRRLVDNLLQQKQEGIKTFEIKIH